MMRTVSVSHDSTSSVPEGTNGNIEVDRTRGQGYPVDRQRSIGSLPVDDRRGQRWHIHSAEVRWFDLVKGEWVAL